MAGHNNKKFLFRSPDLRVDIDTPLNLPKDVADWLDPNAKSGNGAGARGGSGAVTNGDGSSSGAANGFPVDPMYADNVWDEYVVNEPGLTARQPEIMGIVKQEVKQDPQGGATITVTVSIGPEQDDMEYELRLTAK